MNMLYSSFFSLKFFQPAPNSPNLTLLIKTDMITAPGSSAVFLLLHSLKPQEMKCKKQGWNECLMYKLYSLTTELWSTQSFSNTLPANTQANIHLLHTHVYVHTHTVLFNPNTLAMQKASDISAFTFKIIRLLFPFFVCKFFWHKFFLTSQIIHLVMMQKKKEFILFWNLVRGAGESATTTHLYTA